ncbi:MAG TPA: TatD family hydrolase [Dehalococcoidales bacterium]|nr:TatD family hydrolase [Dehalococcoidales bacterium]
MTTPDVSIVDSHAHLTASEFDEDRADVIARARDAGVGTIVTVGTELESSRAAIALAEQHPGILVVAGFHPHGADSVSREDITALGELAQHPKVVAIGEIGLDFHRDYSSRERQREVLRWQLTLVAELDLPIVVHCREAHEEMLPILREWTRNLGASLTSPPGIIHCFVGDTETARKYLDMGFYLSLAAYIGYPSSRYAHDTIRAIPSDRLLVETDCPFFAPQRIRGKRCEPAYVRDTVVELARIRGESVEKVARDTTQNAQRLFGAGKGLSSH